MNNLSTYSKQNTDKTFKFPSRPDELYHSVPFPGTLMSSIILSHFPTPTFVPAERQRPGSIHVHVLRKDLRNFDYFHER